MAKRYSTLSISRNLCIYCRSKLKDVALPTVTSWQRFPHCRTVMKGSQLSPVNSFHKRPPMRIFFLYILCFLILKKILKSNRIVGCLWHPNRNMTSLECCRVIHILASVSISDSNPCCLPIVCMFAIYPRHFRHMLTPFQYKHNFHRIISKNTKIIRKCLIFS